MENKFELHQKILSDMHELYRRKNTDYGDSTHDTYLKFGAAAYLVRMYDKLNRLHTLTQNNVDINVPSETIHDTLMDLANYAILMSMELRMESCKGVKNSYD